MMCSPLCVCVCVCVCADGLLQRIWVVLERYGVDPRDLSPQQLYKLALVLQLLQAEELDKTGRQGQGSALA